jgi:ABC-type transport system substrate-binding protein
LAKANIGSHEKRESQRNKQGEKTMKISKKILLAISVIALLTSTMTPILDVAAQSDQTLFNVTIIAPGNANLVRRQWSQIFATNLQQLGIDAKVVYLGWASVYDRALTPARENVGKIWDDGGYDILALGWTPGLLPEPRQLCYGGAGFFAPDGQNYYLYNSTDSNTQLDTFITSTDPATQSAALKAWQQIYYNDVPASQIMYQAAPAIVNPHVTNWYTPPSGGEGWLYFNAQPYPELLKRDDGLTRVTYCTTGEITDLVPPLSNSWYDTILNGVIFNGLAQPWPTLGSNEIAVPNLLTSWEPSEDGFTWTFNIRQGVTWHDGEPFSANDVVFSLWALMNPDTASQFVGYYQSVYGDKVTFAYSNGTAVTLGNGTRQGVLAASADGKSVTASLPELVGGKPYGYFDPYLLGFANNIIPMHIFEKLPVADWKTSPFNTGQGSITINGKTYTGPVGTGPYKWESYDTAGQIVHLTKNTNYWNASALQSAGLFGITDYYVQYIADKTSALAALKNGEVDVLDTNYQMQLDIPSIESTWGRVLLLDGTGRQEFGYNMQHPIFGTGTATPLGQNDPSKAAEAARYVRTAFDYAIPRQLIIDNLLDGFGQPGITPMLPTQPFFNSSITARPYDLAQARYYLQLAGYSPAGEASGLNLQGTLTYANGTIRPMTSMDLMVTTNNATFPDSLQLATQIITGVDGTWSFTVNPLELGTYYYYLMDNSTGIPEYQFIQSYTVSGASPSPSPTGTSAPPTSTDYTWAYVAVAVVVIIIVIAAVVIVARKRHK